MKLLHLNALCLKAKQIRQFICWHAFSALKYLLQSMKGKSLIYSLLTLWAVKKNY